MGHHNKIPKKFSICSFSEALFLSSIYLKGNHFQKDVVVFFSVETFYGIVNLFQIQIRTFDTMFQSEMINILSPRKGALSYPNHF